MDNLRLVSNIPAWIEMQDLDSAIICAARYTIINHSGGNGPKSAIFLKLFSGVKQSYGFTSTAILTGMVKNQ